MFLRLFSRLSLRSVALSALILCAAATAPAKAQTYVSAPFDYLGAQTLLPNGDFENGLDNWTTHEGTFSTSTVNPLLGTTSARGTALNTFSGAGNEIDQPVPLLTPGETYVLSAFFNTSTLDPNGAMYVDLISNGGLGSPFIGVGLRGGVAATTFAYISFVATEPSVVLRLVFDAPGPQPVPAGSFATADNIAVTPLAQFIPAGAASSNAPEPGTLALLALAGLPLAGSVMRRNPVSTRRRPAA